MVEKLPTGYVATTSPERGSKYRPPATVECLMHYPGRISRGPRRGPRSTTMRTLILRLCIALVVIISAVTADAATWWVRPFGGDANTIQGGIDKAAAGDVVVVGAGTYSGYGNFNVSFDGKDITLMSESGPFLTVIDCQNTGQAFLFTNGESYNAVLEGFTIKNGNGTHGGAIYCDGGSPTIRYNLFCDNIAWSTGGALHTRNGSPTIYNNTFDDNSAPSGGGIFLGPNSDAQIWQNIVCGSSSGGAFACSGAGSGTFIYCNDLYANSGGDVVCVGNAGNNYSLDPLFCGVPGSGNFFLQQTSPCTSTFSPCLAAIGALGVQCTVTATENVSWGKVKTLYR
jgi:hypothetical protein